MDKTINSLIMLFNDSKHKVLAEMRNLDCEDFSSKDIDLLSKAFFNKYAVGDDIETKWQFIYDELNRVIYRESLTNDVVPKVKKKKVIYTIGYTSCSCTNTLVALSKKYNAFIIDVRLVPYSKVEYINDNFSKDVLINYDDCYCYLGELLGNKNYKGGEIELANERLGLSAIKLMLDNYDNIIIMCTEKKYMDCHRTYIARKLKHNVDKLYDCSIIHLVKNKRK